MGNKRFSITTLLLVGFSLAALYFVGTKVTPPPATPPAEAKATQASAAPQPSIAEQQQSSSRMAMDKKDAGARAKKMQEMMQQARAHPPTDKKKFNPSSIEVEPTYWQQNDMGAKGEAEMQKKVAQAEAEAKKIPAGTVTKPTMPSAVPMTDNSAPPANVPRK